MHDRFTTQVYEHICVGRLSCLKDLLVPSTYSIPWVQFWCSWYSGILYSPQFFFDLRCYYYKHSPWVSEHLSLSPLNWDGLPDFLPWSKFLPFLCCLAAFELGWPPRLFALIKILTIFVLFSCQIPLLLLPLSLHILLAPIFLCFFMHMIILLVN